MDTGEDKPEPAEPSPEPYAIGDALEVGHDRNLGVTSGHLLVGEDLGLASGRHRRLPRFRLGLQAGELGQEFFA